MLYNSHPLITVIIPSYNHSKYVRQCMESVVNQTYKNIQLIVIDDGSKDNSVEIIENIRLSNEFIFEVQQNIGLSATLNKAIKKYAKGEFISMIASDDWWVIDKIEKQVHFLIDNPKCEMCYSKTYVVNEKNDVIDVMGREAFSNDLFSELITTDSFIPTLTVMYKKTLHDEIGYFDENLMIEDWDMWLRISFKHKIGFINKPLAYYRLHGLNASQKLDKMAESIFMTLEKWRFLPDYKKIISIWGLILFRRLSQNYKKVSILYMVKSMSLFYKKDFIKGLYLLIKPNF